MCDLRQGYVDMCKTFAESSIQVKNATLFVSNVCNDENVFKALSAHELGDVNDIL